MSPHCNLTDGERLPYTLAIHAGAGRNPHCHLLISERGNDGIERDAAQWFKRYNAAAPERGGARKSTALRPKAWLEETRAAWAEQTNAALERAGHAVRIDHRSLAAQGIDRAPGLHLGRAVLEMEARGIETDRASEAWAIAREDARIRQAYAELAAEQAQLVQEQAQERPAEREREPEREQERRPAPAEVARNPAVEERIAQIQDPQERARAWKLLETIRADVAAQERPRAREREQERGRDRDDFELER